MVALSFSFSSESVEFFTMIHQITHSVSLFSECLESFFDFGLVSFGSSDIISFVVSDVCSLRKHIDLFVPTLGVLHSKFVALHLPKMHDETHK